MKKKEIGRTRRCRLLLLGMCLHLAAWALRRRRHRRRPMAASAYINYNYFVIVLTSVFFLFSMMRDFNLVVNLCLFPFLNDARFQLSS